MNLTHIDREFFSDPLVIIAIRQLIDADPPTELFDLIARVEQRDFHGLPEPLAMWLRAYPELWDKVLAMLQYAAVGRYLLRVSAQGGPAYARELAKLEIGESEAEALRAYARFVASVPVNALLPRTLQ